MERTDENVADNEVVMETMAYLTAAIAHLNAVTLVLLYSAQLKGNLVFPEWETKGEVEASVGGELAKCIELMSNLKEANGPIQDSPSS